MKKGVLSFLVIAITLSGCTASQIINDVDAGRVNVVCIADNQEVKATVLDTIEEGLNNHGVKFDVIPGSYELKNNFWYATVQPDLVSGCDAVLFYVTDWGWDIASYMRFANMWLVTADLHTRLGDASYDARLSLKKYVNAHERLLELVDGLFGQYNKEHTPY
jgi:hypothetical protein